MRVLAIGAHPDDVDLLCGGTLALCAARGDDITIAVATNGEVGSGEADARREEVGAIREAEARASAAVIGATVIWMGFPDEFLFNDRLTRERFIDAIRESRPDILFIHSEDDYHPDHRIAGQIARDARIPASVELVATNFPRTDIPTTFVMDTYKGRNFEPEVFVDISPVVERKKTMLAAHESQGAWMQHVFKTDMAAGMLVQSRFRGEQAGYEYAEGFQLLKDWPYTGDWKLLP
jgi:LmbE family N-acetylglucosaminyl deacetylase